jgi:hypothetical protein
MHYGGAEIRRQWRCHAAAVIEPELRYDWARLTNPPPESAL